MLRGEDGNPRKIRIPGVRGALTHWVPLSGSRRRGVQYGNAGFRVNVHLPLSLLDDVGEETDLLFPNQQFQRLKALARSGINGKNKPAEQRNDPRPPQSSRKRTSAAEEKSPKDSSLKSPLVSSKNSTALPATTNKSPIRVEESKSIKELLEEQIEIEIANDHCVTETISDTELPPEEPGPSTRNLPNLTPAKQAAPASVDAPGTPAGRVIFRARSPGNRGRIILRMRK